MANEFNTSTKELTNTATGDLGANQLDESTGAMKITTLTSPDFKGRNQPSAYTPAPMGVTPEISEEGPAPDEFNTGDEYKNFSGVDLEYVAKVFDGEQNFNNQAADAQSTISKIGNVLGGGVSKGLVAASSPLLDGAASLISVFDEDLAELTRDLDDTFKAQLTANFNYHDYDLSKNAGIKEKFLRWGTAESLTESVTQFAALAALTSMGVGVVGQGLAAAGVSSEAILSAAGVSAQIAAKYGANIQKTLGTLGRYTTKEVPMLGGMLKSKTAITALANNYIEGHVMSDQYERDQRAVWNNVINDPASSKEVVDLVLKNINDSKENLQSLNHLMVITNYLGFSRLFKSVAKGTGIKSVASLDNFKAFSLMEGAEEFAQAGLERSIEHKGLLNIEKDYAAIDNSDKYEDTPGLEYDENGNIKQSTKDAYNRFHSEDALVSRVDPERAEQLATDNARTLGNYMATLATDDEVWVEALSGMFGGGPQWMLTGAPQYAFNRKSIKAQKETKDKFVKETEDVFTVASIEKLKNGATLDALRIELGERVPEGASNEYLMETLDNFIVAKTILDSMANGGTDDVIEIMNEQLSEAKTQLKSGEITQAQFDSINARVELGQSFITKYGKLGSYANGSEQLSAAMRKESLEGALEVFEKAHSRFITDEKDLKDSLALTIALPSVCLKAVPT